MSDIVEKQNNLNNCVEKQDNIYNSVEKDKNRLNNVEKENVLSDNVKKERIVIHILVNICLIFMVFVVTLFCGFIPEAESLAVNKTYRGVIYQGNETTNKVSIMINVYWGTEYLEKMLETLEKHNAKATFFVGKTWAAENKELLKKIYNAGHEIGNHGSNHREHGKLSYEANLKEIEECHKMVESILGIKMNLFAPPGGSYNADTVKAAESLGYKTLLWTFDTIDWRDQDRVLIFSRATANLESGSLILMHPTKATSEALEDIINAVNGKNLGLDVVSNTIKQ